MPNYFSRIAGLNAYKNLLRIWALREVFCIDFARKMITLHSDFCVYYAYRIFTFHSTTGDDDEGTHSDDDGDSDEHVAGGVFIDIWHCMLNLMRIDCDVWLCRRFY